MTITPGAAGINSGDGCSLVEAIINANNDAATYAECVAGNGRDRIILPRRSTLSYLTPYGTDSALPDMTSPITIMGNRSIIQRDSGAADNFRILFVDSGNLTLNNVTISGGNITANGGGILNHFGTVRLNNSIVSGNSARNGGGILNHFGGTVTLNHSILSDNSATYDFSGFSNVGGGIANYDGTVTLNHSTISNNLAYYGGGLHNEDMMVVRNSTISGNSTPVFGGGIRNDGTLTIHNSTLSGNSAAGNGGGIYSSGIVTLNNSTVSGNSAEESGGGIFNDLGTLNLHRSLISGNLAGTGAEIANFSIINANNYNLFGHSGLSNAQAFSGFTPGGTDITATSDGTTPTPLTNILDPNLANNGGPTQTHALVPGSPAVDAAPIAECLPPPINGLDQRGVARNDAGCDSGSFELNLNVANLINQVVSMDFWMDSRDH